MTRPRKAITLALVSLSIAAALAPAPPAPEEPGDIRALAQARVKLAREILAQYREYLVAPPGEKGIPALLEVAEQIQEWTRRLADARIGAAADHAERVAILEDEVKAAREFESLVKELVQGEAGTGKLSTSKAGYNRIEAEIRLAREKAAK